MRARAFLLQLSPILFGLVYLVSQAMANVPAEEAAGELGDGGHGMIESFFRSSGQSAFGVGVLLIIWYVIVTPFLKDWKAMMRDFAEERKKEREEANAIRRVEVEALGTLSNALGELGSGLKEMSATNKRAIRILLRGEPGSINAGEEN